jgi:DNA-binding LacI/PurR family transcriptional regulator
MRPKTPSIKRVSLSEQISAILSLEVSEYYTVGSRLPSEGELAKRFGVSVPTIREALQRLVEGGLVERRRGSGTYVLARPAPEKWVAVLMESDIGQPFISYAHRSAFQQVRRLIAEAGFQTHGYLGFRSAGEEGDLTCAEFLHDLRAGRVSAVVSIVARLPPTLREDLRRRGIPFIGGGPGAPRAMADSSQLVRMGARHLIDCGRERLALLAWADPLLFPAKPSIFVQAFQAELERAGLIFRPEWVREDLHPQWPGAGWEEFREIWQGAEKPDGLLICDDVLAQDVTVAILEQGIRVPEQLMVVTHANRGSGVWYPFPVAKVEFDPDVLAQAIADMTVKQLRGEGTPDTPVVLGYELVPMAAAPVMDGELKVASKGYVNVN